jgi:hypothetical protein
VVVLVVVQKTRQIVLLVVVVLVVTELLQAKLFTLITPMQLQSELVALETLLQVPMVQMEVTLFSHPLHLLVVVVVVGAILLLETLVVLVEVAELLVLLVEQEILPLPRLAKETMEL